jgi:GAF domain
MDHYSILDHSLPPAAGLTPGDSAIVQESSSISAKIAAANTLLPSPSEAVPRLPGEDAGRSLAEMAHRDLDAALQLLAERAQYITGASGTAIALRRGAHNDMLCRAAAGSSAPDLGALLSMEHGLSGECVRTRQLLRCDDAERDPRVNREVCRELGIASVVVMPIVRDEQVLGVFELLSGKPRAFDERDLSALLRLSEMVETAVKHAMPAQIAPQVREEVVKSQPVAANQPAVEKVVEEEVKAPPAEPAPVDAVTPTPSPLPSSQAVMPQETPPVKEKAERPAEKKPLFWSAAMRAQGGEPPMQNAEASAVPPVLRNFQKCQACGFPVSPGRTFCVECEEKQWRGQRIAQAQLKEQSSPLQSAIPIQVIPDTDAKEILIQGSKPDQLSVPTVLDTKLVVPPAEAAKTPQEAKPVPAAAVEVAIKPQTLATTSLPSSSDISAEVAVLVGAPPPNDTAPFLSSALQSESWFAANKYILAALVVVAVVIGAIAWLR